MIDILWNLASFVVALGILVSIHEFGHYWVAKRCGVKIETFSIGFGKSLWKRTGKDGTVYTLSAIPLGGYVKMLDSRVDDISDDQKQFAFDHKLLKQRFAIVAAGPIFNFLLAILAYWLVFLIGIPSVKPVVGEVAPYSISAKAGLESGMELKTVSGVETLDWEAVNMQLISHIGNDEVILTVSTSDDLGFNEERTLDIRQWKFDPKAGSIMSSLGFEPYQPRTYTRLTHVSDGDPAQLAGLQVGDEILSANNNTITEWQEFVKIIHHHPKQSFPVVVSRSGEELEVQLKPESRNVNGTEIGFIGVSPKTGEWPEEYLFTQQHTIFDASAKAVIKTGQVMSLTATMLQKLVTGDVGIDNLSGPISIAKGAGATASYGFIYFLSFLALISINLGIINLVPLPILDGGHLLFFAIEGITRRPVPEKIQDIGYRFGGAIIFSLMAVAIFNDLMNL